jgi:sulfite reductase alpha subunit-like flavoprotein
LTFVDGPTEETDPKSLSMAARQLSISKRIHIASIKEVRQNTEEGSTLEVIFSLRGDDENSSNLLDYKTGENFCFFPENSDDDVAKVLQILEVDEDTAQKSVKLSGKGKIPFAPCKVIDALKKHVDLYGPISKKMLTNLAQFANEEEASLMKEIAVDKKLL